MDRAKPTATTSGKGFAYYCYRCDAIAGSFIREGDEAQATCAYCGTRPFVLKGGHMTHSEWKSFCDRFFDHYGAKRNEHERLRSS